MHGKMKNSHFINHNFSITYDMSNKSDTVEIRRIQALTGERSFTLIFPKQFAAVLGVGRGDFVKCKIDGGRLVVEKMNP